MTDRKSLDDMTSNDLDHLYDDLDRAHTELRWWAEADSADAAAGSYALRAERAEQERNEARQRAADAYGQRDRLRQRIAALAERWQLPGHISMPDAAAEIAEALDREKWAPAPDPLTRVRAIPRLPHPSQQTGELGRAYTRGWESVISAIDAALSEPK